KRRSDTGGACGADVSTVHPAFTCGTNALSVSSSVLECAGSGHRFGNASPNDVQGAGCGGLCLAQVAGSGRPDAQGVCVPEGTRPQGGRRSREARVFILTRAVEAREGIDRSDALGAQGRDGRRRACGTPVVVRTRRECCSSIANYASAGGAADEESGPERDREARERMKHGSAGISMKPLRVLIVDDEPSICRALVIALERAGCIALSATSGSAALDLLRHEPVDVLVMDLRMPDLRGDVVAHFA